MVKLRICRFFAVGIKTKVFYLHPSSPLKRGTRDLFKNFNILTNLFFSGKSFLYILSITFKSDDF